MTWEELRQLWTALGYTQQTFSSAAQKEFPGVRGLSQPRISRRLAENRNAPVPHVVADWALTLTPLSGAEKGHAAFRRAKASSEAASAKAEQAPPPTESSAPPERESGANQSGGTDPAGPPASQGAAATHESRMNISILDSSTNEEASEAVAAHESRMNLSIQEPIPAVETRDFNSVSAPPGAATGAPPMVEADAANAVPTTPPVTPVHPSADELASVTKRAVMEAITELPKPPDSSEVAKMAATEAVAQQPKPPHPSEVAAHVVRALRPFFALIAVLLLTGFVGVAALGRHHPAQAPSAPAAAPTPSVVVNFGAGLLTEASAQRLAPRADNAPYIFGACPLEAGQMGDKAPGERYIPKNPLPGQKLAPNCDPEAGESTINGACWGSMRNKQPPCGRRLFRSGNECYAPVAADPNVPVSSQPE